VCHYSCVCACVCMFVMYGYDRQFIQGKHPKLVIAIVCTYVDDLYVLVCECKRLCVSQCLRMCLWALLKRCLRICVMPRMPQHPTCTHTQGPHMGSFHMLESLCFPRLHNPAFIQM